VLDGHRIVRALLEFGRIDVGAARSVLGLAGLALGGAGATLGAVFRVAFAAAFAFALGAVDQAP
jgi:hypothetical protein